MNTSFFDLVNIRVSLSESFNILTTWKTRYDGNCVSNVGVGALTAVTNCCANCVEPSCFLGKPAMRTRWMAGAAPHKSG